jgi:hypothetical protein
MAATASGSRSESVTVAVTTMPKFTSPAPWASSWAVCATERASTKARALGRFPEVMRTLALFWSRSTTVAARAESIGRYSRDTRFRSMSPCGASSRDRTEEFTEPRGAPVMVQETENALSCR